MLLILGKWDVLNFFQNLNFSKLRCKACVSRRVRHVLIFFLLQNLTFWRRTVGLFPKSLFSRMKIQSFWFQANETSCTFSKIFSNFKAFDLRQARHVDLFVFQFFSLQNSNPEIIQAFDLRQARHVDLLFLQFSSLQNLNFEIIQAFDLRQAKHVACLLTHQSRLTAHHQSKIALKTFEISTKIDNWHAITLHWRFLLSFPKFLHTKVGKDWHLISQNKDKEPPHYAPSIEDCFENFWNVHFYECPQRLTIDTRLPSIKDCF